MTLFFSSITISYFFLSYHFLSINHQQNNGSSRRSRFTNSCFIVFNYYTSIFTVTGTAAATPKLWSLIHKYGIVLYRSEELIINSKLLVDNFLISTMTMMNVLLKLKNAKVSNRAENNTVLKFWNATSRSRAMKTLRIMGDVSNNIYFMKWIYECIISKANRHITF